MGYFFWHYFRNLLTHLVILHFVLRAAGGRLCHGAFLPEALRVGYFFDSSSLLDSLPTSQSSICSRFAHTVAANEKIRHRDSNPGRSGDSRVS